jgi:hypothetical protein
MRRPTRVNVSAMRLDIGCSDNRPQSDPRRRPNGPGGFVQRRSLQKTYTQVNPSGAQLAESHWLLTRAPQSLKNPQLWGFSERDRPDSASFS